MVDSSLFRKPCQGLSLKKLCHFSALEASGRGFEPAPLHLGRHLQAHTISSGEGSSLLPIPELHRVRWPRATALISRRLGLPEKGAAIFYPFYGRSLFVHGLAGPAHASVSGVDGSCGPDSGELADHPLQLSHREGRLLDPELFHPNDFQNLNFYFCCRQFLNQDEFCFKRLLDVFKNVTFNVPSVVFCFKMFPRFFPTKYFNNL